MTGDAFEKEFRRRIRLDAERGNAGTFAQALTKKDGRKKEDRELVEQSTAQEWAKSYFAEYGIEVCQIASGKTEVPDCTGIIDGFEIGIELTEMVDRELLRDIDKQRKKGINSSVRTDFYSRAQWDKSRFHLSLCERLQDKIENYDRPDQPTVDILIIYSGEYWLFPADVKKWLTDFEPSRSEKILNAFFLMDYRPQCATHWPIFPIFGPMTQPK